MNVDILNLLNMTLMFLLIFSFVGLVVNTYMQYRKNVVQNLSKDILLKALGFVFNIPKSQYTSYEKYRIWIFIEKVRVKNNAYE